MEKEDVAAQLAELKEWKRNHEEEHEKIDRKIESHDGAIDAMQSLADQTRGSVRTLTWIAAFVGFVSVVLQIVSMLKG